MNSSTCSWAVFPTLMSSPTKTCWEYAAGLVTTLSMWDSRAGEGGRFMQENGQVKVQSRQDAKGKNRREKIECKAPSSLRQQSTDRFKGGFNPRRCWIKARCFLILNPSHGLASTRSTTSNSRPSVPYGMV